MSHFYPAIIKKAKGFLFVLSFLLVFFSLISSSNVSAQTQTVTITKTGTGTWTAPCGVTSITVEAWGGGGGGGGATANGARAGGGSGGAYTKGTFPVDPGTTYNLSVGAGGAGNTSSTLSPGGDTWVGSNSILMAKGGGGAALVTTNVADNGAVQVSSGNVNTGTEVVNTYGSAGSSASGSASGAGGNGGNGGAGGTSVTSGNNGNQGTSPGGGGSGGYRISNYNSKNGGAGGNGQIVITYDGYCTPSFSSGAAAIQNVTFAGINNSTSSGSSEQNLYFCSPAGNVIQGGTYLFSFKGYTSNTYYYVTVFIDWNQNGSYDDAGESYEIGVTRNSGTATANIVVPAGALTGTTNMRVFQRQNYHPATACGNAGSWGQTQDYVINVISPASITTGIINPLSYCAGTSISVPFTSSGTFKAGNIYTAQLSNASGSFASPTSIGTLSSTANSGTIIATVPAGTPVGTGYRIRIVSSNPAATGSINVSNISINNVPAQPSTIIGTTPVCAGSSQTYSVANVAGVTFTWSTPTGWTLNSGQDTRTVNYTVGTTGGTVQVTPSNTCGNGTPTTLAVAVSSLPPAQPSSITGNASFCVGGSQTYSVTNVAGVTYTWSAPSGWTVTSGQGTNSITYNTTAATSGTVTVTPSNSCGNGTAQTLGVTVNTVPIQPSVIIGNNPFCQGVAQTYSVTNVTGVTYTWAAPAGWTITSGQGTNSITYSTVAATSGTLQVTPSNGCGNGTMRTLAVNVNTVPAQPIITGTESVCASSSQTYTVANVSGVTFTWNTPSGWTLVSGQGSNAVVYTIGSDPGTVQVTPTNTCGTGTAQTLAVAINSTGTWTGVTSTDWNTASNWCGGVPTATTDVMIPAVGLVPRQPIIGAAGGVCRNIILNGTLGFSGGFNLNVNGDWTNNGTFTATTNSSVTFTGSGNNTLAGNNATTFYNLVVNKNVTTNKLTSITNVFTATNLNVNQGNLVLTATDANYTVSGDITVPAAGILSHNVDWGTGKLLSVGGNISIDGIFNYAVARSHVQMTGSGKTVRTGANAASALSILTLGSTGNIAASGTLRMNDNFWAMFGTTGSFSTGANTIYANAGFLMNNGSVNINGGTVNVINGISIGTGNAAVLNFSSGTINADNITIGAGVAGTFTCTNSPVINITGNWTNNGTFTAATSQTNLIGSATQTIEGTSQSTFNILNINNGYGVTLGNNATASNTLSLTNGVVTTGVNTLTSSSTSAAAITGGSATAYVDGKLARNFSTGAGSKVFPVGAGGNYRPLTFAYTASSATSVITVQQFETPIPGTVTPATTTKDVRYWEITKTGTGTATYTVTLDPTYTPSPAGSIVQIIKKEGTNNALTATAATAPNYTNSTVFNTFNGNTTASGTNSFAIGVDCSSSANAGSVLASICQGGTSAGLGGSISGTTTTGTWTDGGIGGTFNPNANTLNATWTAPATYVGTATLTLTPTGGICAPNAAASKTIVVNAPPVISGHPADQVTCAGTAKTFSVTLSAGTSPAYQWQYSATGTGGWANVANNTPVNTTYGVTGTTANLTITPGAAAAAGTYYYRCVVSVNSCSSTTSNPASLTVNINSTISLTSVAGSVAQALCQYTPLTTITYAVGGGGTGITRTGSLPAGVTGVYTPGVYTISGTPTTSGNFSYTVKTTGPCGNQTLSGTINVIAAANGTFTATKTTICQNESVTFTAPKPTAPEVYAYTFYVDGTKVQGPNNANTYSTSTLTVGARSVTVDVVNTNNCGVTFGPIVITVTDLPAPVLTVTGTQAGMSVCTGVPVTLTADAHTGSTYSFIINGATVITSASNTYIIPSVTATTTVAVMETNSNGCKETTATQTITVNPVPAGTLSATETSVTANDNKICVGENITFTALPLVAGNTYNFKINGASIQDNSSNIYSSTTFAAGTYVISVEVTNATGCTANYGPLQTITVSALPTGTLTATENSGIPNDNIICKGSPVTFAATSGYKNYKFYINGSTTPAQDGSGFIFTRSNLSDQDEVSVVATNTAGCSTTFNKITVTVVDAPTGTLTASSSAVCAGGTITLSADLGYSNYNFKRNNVTFSNGSSNTSDPVIPLASGDVFTVEVSNTQTCTAVFGPVSVTVNPLPTGTLLIAETSGIGSSNDGIICKGAKVTFTAPLGFTNYNFKINETTVQNGVGRIFEMTTLSNNDVVSVEVTNATNCFATLNSYTITVNDLPPVLPITAVKTDVCVNDVITLVAPTSGGNWSTSNSTIATVDASGIVTGKGEGIATIYYTVKNTNNCDSTVSIDITVNALPVADPILGASKVCVGSTTQLTEITPDGVWSSSDTDLATVDGTGLVTGVSSGSVIISYTVTNTNGCKTIITKNIAVNDLPVVDAIGGTFKVCVGANTSLTYSPGTGVKVWTSSDPTTATVNPVGLVHGVKAGTVTITFTVTNSNGCSTSVEAEVIVNDLPVPTLSGPNPICPNTIETYYTEATGKNYSWTVIGGEIQSGGESEDYTVKVKWGPSGTKSVYVNYENESGCAAATSVTINNGSISSPTFTGDLIVCQNTPLHVYTAPEDKEDYTWTIIGGDITSGDNTNEVTVTWTDAGTKSITLNYAEIGGCNAATPTVKSIKVNPEPTLLITNPPAVCSPFTVNLTLPAVKFGSTTGLTFTYWTDAAATFAVSDATKVGAGTYYIKGTTTSGCFVIKPVQVTVNPTPSVEITNPAAVCSPGTVDLTAAGVTDGSTPGLMFTYWTDAAGTAMIPNSTSVGAGTYYIKGSTLLGCHDIQPVTVTVNPLPTATIAGNTTVCQNNPSPGITFTGANGTAPYTFTYKINGGADLTATSTGSTATVTVPTNNAGSFAYTLVNVQDASTTLCTNLQTGTATVNIDPTSMGGSVTSSATVCYGTNSGILNLAGNNGSIIRWESSTDGVNWTIINNTTSSYTYNNLIQNTQYRAVVQSGTCATANSSAATITITPVSVGGTVGNNATVCAGTNSGTLNLSGQTGTVVGWESSINGGTTWTTISNTGTSQPYSNLTQTTQYRAVVSNGVCAAIKSAIATITVNQRPTGLITGTQSTCNGGSAILTVTVTGSGTVNGTLLPGNIPFSGTAGPITLSVSPATNTTYTIATLSDANCTSNAGDITGSAVVTVNGSSPISSLTASPSTICLGSSSNLFIPTGTTNLISEDFEGNNSFSVGSTGDNKSNASWTNRTSTYRYQYGCIIGSWGCTNVDFNSGSKFMLANSHAGGGNTNTALVSPTVSTIGYTSLTLTYRTYFRKAGSEIPQIEVSSNNGATWISVQQLNSTTGTVNKFSPQNVNLNAYINNASFQVRFRYSTSNAWYWAIDDIVVSGNQTLGDYSWTATPSAGADLPFDADVPSNSNSNIIVTPTAPGDFVYTATLTNGFGCTSTKTVTLNVNPTPVVTIGAQYCDPANPGKVTLTATSNPAATSYLWSNGETGNVIHVDIADVYTVTATLGGCTSTEEISIAQELVENGDFEQGDVGFTSAYTAATTNPDCRRGTGGLYPEGLYKVDTNGQNTHCNFWGKDHTTGSGNFMIVNGASTPFDVWTQKLNVLPNTTYYFSAWAMSMNSAGNYAKLQFKVADELVGTTVTLVAHGERSNSPDNWERFYGTWTSGPTMTSVVVSIRDLTTSPGGNDFGLDDISFGTLSTFITLVSDPETDAQTVCVNNPLTDIVYNLGNGSDSGPTVSGLPDGVNWVFSVDKLTISGTPTVPGDYTYTITTTGCTPFSVTGTIKVQSQTIALKSGSSSPSVCINTALTNIVYEVGGAATGASVTSGTLPTGLTGTWDNVAKTFTISGTPTVAGAFDYTVTTTGTCAPAAFLSGTITVQNQTIELGSGDAVQAVCINESVSPLIYTIGGTGTGATISSGSLPPGVSGFYTGGSFIISGTPVIPASGTYNFTISTTGLCSPAAELTGSITVNPAATIALTSGNDEQTVCINTGISDINYTVGGGGTDASISSGTLPDGVTGSFSNGVFSISGTPSEAGVFTYTVTTTGTCAQTSISGSLIVQTQSIELTSGGVSPTLCVGSTLTNIVLTIGGTGSSAVLTSGSFPDGITGSYDPITKQYTISGSPSELGSFSYTISTSGTCEVDIIEGTITVNSGSIGGTLPAMITGCGSAGGNLNLAGSVGNVVRWESSIDGTTWTNIANTTTTLPYNVNVPTQFRALVKSGSCNEVYSTVVLVALQNYWTGAVGTDWQIAGNWSDGQLPGLTCPNVYIPNTPNKPVLADGSSTIRNIYIDADAILTVKGTGKLQIAGTINNNGTFDAREGEIELNGPTAQNIGAGTFMNNAVKDLKISNNTGVNVNHDLDVYGSLAFGSPNAKINTNGNLTLKSNIHNTAWVGQMTNTQIIDGDVTVERFINTGTDENPEAHRKSWNLLAVPTDGAQTIHQAWQEGAATINTLLGDPKPGYGTMIVSNKGGASGATGLGFDQFTAPGPSIKVYNPTSGDYDGPPNTLNTSIYNIKGYLVLVRGDRSVFTFDAKAKPTTLRSKGRLFTPAHPPVSTSISANKFESVGNPYASAIDLRKVTVTGDLVGSFIVWDPRAQGAYGLGAFTTLTKSGTNFYATPATTSYPGTGVPYNFIESGQAFFIQSVSSSGTISFTEAAKVSDNNPQLLRGQGDPGRQAQLRTNLYVGSGTNTTLADGTLIQYDVSYSNELDRLDARKLTNLSENLGLSSNGKTLVVERRAPIVETDTVFFKISGMRVQPYKFEFIANDLAEFNVEGTIEDNYLGTKTPLSMEGKTEYSFTIENKPGSYAADRFRIVFQQIARPLPVTFVSLRATQKADDILVGWKVENETNTKEYEVEKSLDGTRFVKIATIAALNNGAGNYNWLDKDVTPGWNYYRIKSIDQDGKLSYSEVVRVMIEKIAPLITVYPNPIVNGVINVHLVNQPAGTYKLRLLNALGQTMVAKQVTRDKGTSIEPLTWDYKLARGNYRIEITKPDGGVKLITVIY